MSDHHHPHQLNNLRLCLASLYSLHPSPGNGGNRPTTQQAHDFLLQFQSRNVRRKIQSQGNNKKQQQQQQQQQLSTVDPNDIGSTWLASVALLAQFMLGGGGSGGENQQHSVNNNTVSNPEALFAAQTVLHRLRRIKLSEAVDVEIEPNPELPIEQQSLFHLQQDPSARQPPMTSMQLIETYRSWSRCFHPVISHMIHKYHPQESSDEECIKGELAMITIAAIIYCTTARQYHHHHHHHHSSSISASSSSSSIRPLISLLGSALAVLASRLRYTSQSLPQPTTHTQPIVVMILQSLHFARDAVAATTTGSAIQPNDELQRRVHAHVVYACLAALPDSLLAGSGGVGGDSGGGGAHGRISMDPRCFSAVTSELRASGSGSSLVWQALTDLHLPSIDNNNMPDEDVFLLVLFLTTCEQWAKYVALPLELVHATIPLVNQAFGTSAERNATVHRHNHHERPSLPPVASAAMAYWIALVEGGTWTVEQILTASLMQPNEASKQPNKKRQTSRSKKRNKEELEKRTTDDLLVNAQAEVSLRGQVACQTAMSTWEHFWPILTTELQAMAARSHQYEGDEEDEVPGDGPINGITACANACLPYLVRQSVTGALQRDTSGGSTASNGSNSSQQLTDSSSSLRLFMAIAQGVQEICSSPVRIVRAFAAETLYTLHVALVEVVGNQGPLPVDFEEVVVNHFFRCSMSLGTHCGYPANYFLDMGANNDEELEQERNDIRDVLRAVAGCAGPDGSTRNANGNTVLVTSRILLQVLQICADSIQATTAEITKGGPLFPESAAHAFSALAKPVNQLAQSFVISPFEESRTILKLTLGILATMAEQLVGAFPRAAPSELFPVSRLSNLALSSFAPTLSALVSHPEFEQDVLRVVNLSIKSSAMSLATLPELSAPSTLRSTRYDIRGAMRSPGGEDHVGCLALMRLATESDQLAHLFLRTDPSIVRQLCELYEKLKTMETERGQGVLHGHGVLPKSRRILLGLICHLEIVTAGAASVSGVLRGTFDSAIYAIAHQGQQSPDFSADTLSRICENVFDIAAFSPTMIQSLYEFEDANSPKISALKVLHQAGIYGYHALSTPSMSPDAIFQWNRLRAALFTLLQASGTPDLPAAAVEMSITFIRTECEAIVFQCKAGPTSSSPIFRDEIIGEEGVPAGNIVRAIGELIERAIKSGHSLESVPNCLRVLSESRASVLNAIASDCPSPVQKGSFEDPRPTLAEAWLRSMDQIAQAASGTADFHGLLQNLLVESCASSLILLLYPTMGKTQEHRLHDPGMSMDGPQSLALTDFFTHYFALGPQMLQGVAEKLLHTVPVDTAGLQQWSNDPACLGVSVAGACLFRAAQGGLPPWAVESIPSVYSSLFSALNKDPNSFGLIFRIAMHVRLLNGTNRYGGVQPGHLLSGKYFATMNDTHTDKFVADAVEIARVDNPTGWRRLKGLIKQACGGKKKDTDFNQRPAPTRWEFDRI